MQSARGGPGWSAKGALARLGLGRPELRAWAAYDWANSAFYTVVITAVFPPFFISLAEGAGIDENSAGVLFSYATALSLAVVAIVAPVLGALADHLAWRKRMLFGFVLLGVLATGGMSALGPAAWLPALFLFGLANAGAGGSAVFYDSLLPHIARRDEVDRVSTAGFALGYVGGGLALGLCLAWIQAWEWFGFQSRGSAVRSSFAFVAAWWLIFTFPLLKRVREPGGEASEATGGAPVRVAFSRLRQTLRDLHGYKHALCLLAAFLVYNDGVLTIIRMATILGKEREIAESHMILAILLVQFVGVPFALCFGALAERLGPKRSILLGLAVYVGISLLGYGMTEVWHFYALAILVGTVQGGVQALSRSLFASMIPAHKATEFFGFFAVGEKFAGIMGPLLFGLVLQFVGSTGAAILGVATFFVIGGALLCFVDVEAGRAAARRAEAALRERSASV